MIVYLIKESVSWLEMLRDLYLNKYTLFCLGFVIGIYLQMYRKEKYQAWLFSFVMCFVVAPIILFEMLKKRLNEK
jgi:hypothetical protein